MRLLTSGFLQYPPTPHTPICIVYTTLRMSRMLCYVGLHLLLFFPRCFFSEGTKISVLNLTKRRVQAIFCACDSEQ